jgi:predicted ATP-binding protein involved in virulence
MIKRLIVKNLNGKHDFDLTFHPDINIFIGKNGAGKTTLMKLIWALVSGNIEILFADKIYFDYLKVEDNDGYYELIVDKIANKVQYTVFPDEKNEKHTEILKFNLHKYNIEESTLQFQTEMGNIFFPTFRRIEGGFGLNAGTQIATKMQDTLSEVFLPFEDEVYTNKFITSVSTNDIVELLGTEYANIAKKIIDLQTELLKEVANKTNGELKKYLEQGQIDKEILQKPFTELSQLVKDIFNKGIKITKDISIGDEANAISADKLSSGEKQMLSFFAYNMFYKKAAIFIDEPEISLHTDWQKVLFPSLLAQGTENQFFVATHSPFIYAKYPDKTFNLSK